MSAEIVHTDGGDWMITDAGQQLARYRETQVRISILWKGRVATTSDSSTDVLTPGLVVEHFAADLADRGEPNSIGATLLSDDAWIDRLHAIYYPTVTVE